MTRPRRLRRRPSQEEQLTQLRERYANAKPNPRDRCNAGAHRDDQHLEDWTHHFFRRFLKQD